MPIKPTWLSRNTFAASDYLFATDLNNLANDLRTWGGNVNGGGYILSNVILQGSGGFQYQPSPVQITPSAAGSSCVQLDQTIGVAPNQTQVARWTVCKDATVETGSGNTGSNFAIGRYTDAGVIIDTPIAINRSNGLITMGAQQWAGAVNGGGQTLSNVILSGVSVPGTVPTTRKINTGVGLSGGGDLSADRTIVGVVFGPSGASHAAGDVPDPGATAGTTRYLREDGWAVPPGGGGGTANYWVNGALVGTQPTVNFIAGTNVTIGGAVSGSRVDITITASGTGGTGSPQTPWAQNINAAGFSLDGAGTIRSTGFLAFATGAGVELEFTGGTGYVTSYDRGAGAFLPLSINGMPVTINGHTGAVALQPTGGNVGIGIASPLRELHVANIPAGGGVAITGMAPSLVMSNADTEPNTNTMAVGIGLSTASGNYALPHVGDSVIFNQGSARGDIHINSNYAGGGAAHNVILQPGTGNVGVGTATPAVKFTVVGVGSDGGGTCDVRITGSGTIGAGINLSSTDTGGRTWAILSTGSASGAGALAFFDSTAGSYGMWITGSHLVGIGTTQPGALLHVQGDTQPLALFKTNSVSPAIELRDSAATPNRWWLVSGIGTPTDGKFSIYDARQGVSRIAVDPTGNVGIGTQGPVTLLHVAAASGPTAITVGQPSAAALEIQATNSLYSNVSQNATQASGAWALRDASKEGWTLGFTASTGAAGGVSIARFAPNNGPVTTLFNAASNGNIGLGTSGVPAYQLQITGGGGGQVSGNLDDAYPTGASIFLNENSAAAYHGGQLIIGCNGARFAAIRGYFTNGSNNGYGQLHFLTRTNMTDTTLTPKMMISEVGNIGIATITPQYKLDVVGYINCTSGFLVNGAALATGGVSIQHNAGGSSGPYQYLNFTDTANIFWTLTPGGPGNNTMTVWASYAASDARLKQNVVPLDGGLSVIERLRPIRGEWNGLAGRPAGQPVISVIAQELQEVEPDAVYTFPAKLRPEDDEPVEVLGLQTMALTAHLILAVQQLSLRLKALEGRN